MAAEYAEACAVGQRYVAQAWMGVDWPASNSAAGVARRSMSARRIPYFVTILTVVMAIVVIGMGVQAALGFVASRVLEDVAAEAQMARVRATSSAFLAERLRAAGLALRLLARDPRIVDADGAADQLES